MSHILNPESVMQAVRDGTQKSIKQFFPIAGRKNSLILENIYAGDLRDSDDITSQRRAKVTGRTWATPIYGDFKLVENETGKVIDSKKKVKLLNLPQITNRYSYIIDGTEYQVDNLWRLKSGVYTRRRNDGGLETQFNLAKGRGFRMLFDPLKKEFFVKYGTSNIPLVPVLSALGVKDEELSKTWGKEIFEKGKTAKHLPALQKMAKSVSRGDPKTADEATELIKEALGQTVLREDTTAITLGKGYKTVDRNSLLAASKKLLSVHRGESKVDNRDALQFKELWSTEDFIPERITNSRRRIERRVKNNLDRRDSVRSIMSLDIFNVPVKAFFTSTAISQQTDQTNPLDMISSHMRTTLIGPGGISSEAQLANTLDPKLIDPSHMGILDPVATPEGKRSGITLFLGLGVSKDGNEPSIELYDTKAKKFVKKTPPELAGKNISFPDQYTWADGKPTPRSKEVTVSSSGKDPHLVKSGDVDFIVPSPKSMFSLTTNMVPFLPSIQPNRGEMAVRHMEQAISLKEREAPLVQTHTGSKKEDTTWEGVVGKFSATVSPVSGTVESVGTSEIKVRDSKGTLHKVPVYNNYPLNEVKSFMHSEPVVKKGDKVKKGELLADNNFTKGGTLALGKNLRVAYMPMNGATFEDAILISESASEKLTSSHLHKNRSYIDKNMQTGKAKFRAAYPGVLSDANAAKLDDDGVIKVGSTVEPGEVITTILQKSDPNKEQLLLRGIHKSLRRPYKDRSLTWDKQYSGEVVDVIKNGREITVLVKTEEPADVGDKISGRSAQKGIVGSVRPDDEMPTDKDGNPVDVVYGVTIVGGRINPSQILETKLGKLAKEKGAHYAVSNFEPQSANKIVKVKGHYRTVTTKAGPKTIYIKPYEYELGYEDIVNKMLAENDVPITEELTDPKTGKSYGKVFTGWQYIIKHKHQVDKKLAARSHGYGAEYDANMAPKGGGKQGAQRFGNLGVFALLAHGSVHNIRDASLWKSDRSQDEVWTAIQTGSPMPPPRTPFAYNKFVAYLNALGVNVEKEGNELILTPMTDKEILKNSAGELTEPTKTLRGKDLKPEKGGLFDESVTGGVGGDKWSHFPIATAMPNPMFEKAIVSLLGIAKKDYAAIMAGDKALNEDGEVVPASDVAKAPVQSLIDALKGIDVDKELPKALEEAKTATKSKLDKAVKRAKFLSALDRIGLSADEAYILKNVPVLPPAFRPITAMEGGDLNIDGLNLLYRDIAFVNSRLKEAQGVLPDEELKDLHADLYQSISAFMSVSTPQGPELTFDGRVKPPGVLSIIAGRGGPKTGFFHDKVLDRKQDLTMRSVIAPDVNLHLDELGLPRKGAMEIFKPFVVQELVRMGKTPLQAREAIEDKSALANRALEVVASKRPVLFKRDPALHKFSIMGFKAKLIDSKSIHIHPLVEAGFGSDHDGDQMSVYVPISQEAVDEAYNMFPSKNLFNPATGRVMYMPTLEGQLGLYLLTQMGKDSKKKFPDSKAAIAAAKKGEISFTDVITVGKTKTTAGRLSFVGALPKSMQDSAYKTDAKLVMDKKNLAKVLTRLAKEEPGNFRKSVDAIKSLGFGYAHSTGFSFSDKDFVPLRKVRAKILKDAQKKVNALPKGLSREKRDAEIVKIYTAATDNMKKDAIQALEGSGNSLYTMHKAGIKPAWAQLQQLLLAPMLLQNAKGKVIPAPVTKSYTEGLDASGYWISSSGARKGLIEKVQSVSVPGALSKQIMNATLPLVVTANDCGTGSGVSMNIGDRDLVDRFLAKKVKVNKRTYEAGTLVTPKLMGELKASKVSRVVVRSPLKCTQPKGLCGTCYGQDESGRKPQIGTNIGALAGQSVGERSVQISLKQFHMGGLAGSSGKVATGMDRVIQLLRIPQKLPDSAVLAPKSGKIESISKSAAGGYDVNVGGSSVYVPAVRQLKVKKGAQIRKGQRLTDGDINPRELLEKTNISTVQRYLTDELDNIFATEGVKKRNLEVVTKSLTNLGTIEDPGSSEGLFRGDYVSMSYADSLNKKLKSPIRYKPVLRGVETIALDRTTDWLARLQYRRLKETLVSGVSEGWRSDIHGLHPAPGLAYAAELGKSKDKAKPY